MTNRPGVASRTSLAAGPSTRGMISSDGPGLRKWTRRTAYSFTSGKENASSLLATSIIARLQAVPSDHLQHVGQPGAGDAGVLRAVAVAYAADRPEGALAGLPQLGPGGGVAAGLELEGVVPPEDRLHATRQPVHQLLDPVHL